MIRMSKNKAFLLLCMLTLLLSVCSGCWDRRELEERISVFAVAIDHVEDEVEGGRFLLTMQIPIPIRIAGGVDSGGGGEGGINAVKVISSTGRTVADAFNNIQNRLNQELFMGHTRVIAIGENVAEKGVNEMLDGFRRDPALRRLLWFLVVEGEARKLLLADPRLEQIPTVYIMTLIESGAKEGSIPDLTLGQYYIAESSEALQPIANFVRAGKDDLSWVGVGLFNQGRMIGKLNARETWALMRLRGDGEGGDMVINTRNENEDQHFTIRPKKVKVHKKVSVDNERVKAHYDIDMSADIVEKSTSVMLNNPEGLRKLENIAARELEADALNLIRKLQKEYQVDVIKLGQHVKAYHYHEWKNMNWNETFANADISVSFKVRFRQIGMKLVYPLE